MKKGLKRTLTILLVIGLALMLPAGCSNDKTPTGSGAAGTSTITPAETTPAETERFPEKEYASKGVYDTASYVYPMDTDVSISCWKMVFSEFQSAMGVDFADRDCIAQLEKNTGVHVNWIVVGMLTAQENMMSLIASGDYPDIMGDAGRFYTGANEALYADGISIDLTPYIRDYAPNYYQEIVGDDAYNSNDFITDEGRFLAMYQPNLEGWPCTTGMMIRQDWLDDLNMDMPVTYDDWYNVLMAFKTEKGCKDPMYIEKTGVTANTGYHVLVTCTQREAAFYQVDGEVKFGPLEKENWCAYIELMQKWWNDGLLFKDFTGEQDQNQMQTYFGTDRIGAGSYKSFVLYSAGDYSDDPDFNLQPVSDPRQSADQKLHLITAVELVEGGGGCIVTVNCKDIEVAMRWLDYGFTEEGRLLSSWGAEGVSYTIDENCVPHPTELITNNPEGYSANAILSRYATTTLSVQDYRASTTEAIQYVAAEVWTDGADWDWRIPSCATMTTDESSEYARLYSDLQTLVEEYVTGLITGSRSLGEYDSFVEGMYSLGLERCLQIKQASLDRYYEREMAF